MELVRKGEAENARLKRAIEEVRLQGEQMAASVRAKHQEAMAELANQVDALNKSRNRLGTFLNVIPHETVFCSIAEI